MAEVSHPLRYWHMSGAGNDFAVMDIRGMTLDLPALAVKLCRITGADGFLALDSSEIADFRLHFYNADGLRGEMCGNGARCICKFAYETGIAGPSPVMETDAGLVPGWRRAEDRYQVQLNLPGVTDLQRKPQVAYIELGCPGIPHAVVHCPALTWSGKEALREEAVRLRYDTAFPKGVNVNFYRLLDKNTAQILTYERGVEDYTLACGTGSASVAVTLWQQGLLPGGKLTAENEGGTLGIEIRAEGGQITQILLEGPVQTLGTYIL